MLSKILGVFDILIALIFILNNNFDRADTWFPNSMVLIAGIILLLKGIFFVVFLDFATIIDISCALVIIFSLTIHIHVILAALVFIFLAQKGFFSIVS